jgi:phosphate transporter
VRPGTFASPSQTYQVHGAPFSQQSTNAYLLFSIYTLEKQVNQPGGQDGQDAESPLLGGTLDSDTTFKRMLDSELEKVCSFYQMKEKEIYAEMASFMKDVEEYREETQSIDSEQMDSISRTRHLSLAGRARTGSMFGGFGGFKRPRRSSTLSASIEEEEEEADSDDEAVDDSSPLAKKKPPMKVRSKSAWDANVQSSGDLSSSRELAPRARRSSLAFDEDADENLVILYDSGLTLKKRAISLYVSLCELRSFIQLNKTGFSKALKKYDKTLDRNLRRDYTDKVVSPSYPFRETTMQQLDESIKKTETAYADVVTKGDLPLAKRELRLHLREHVVWERNTVWRDMIGIERKAQAAKIGVGRTLLGDHDPSNTRLTGDHHEMGTKEFLTPVGRYHCPKWLFSSTFLSLVTLCAIFIVLLLVPIMEKPEQQNCLAMLVFVSLLWATEVRMPSRF